MENITLGDIQNWIVFLASIITGGGIILAFALKIGKNILRNELRPFSERMDKIDRDRKEQHEETMEQIAKLEKKVDFNDIDVVRNRIVAFENLCRLDVNNNEIKKHQYKTYFKDEDKWAMYHKLYSELNGEINSAIESINEHYKKAKFK